MSDNALTPAALRWLAGPRGQQCLERAADFDAGDSLRAQRLLRADFDAHHCRAALALLETRRAGADKFGPLAAHLFGDRDGVEMASRREVAAHRAGRFAALGPMADLGCGIGGDLLALAARGPVCGVDVDAARLTAAGLNTVAAGVEARVELVRGDATAPPVPTGLPFFADPSRRAGGRRVRAGAAYHPPLQALLDLGRGALAAGIKVAPGIREQDLPDDAEVEFVSAGGQCREAVIWLGELAGPRRRATLLPGPHTLIDGDGGDAPVPVAPPGEVLYDPDPAVVRAHLVQPLARRLDAWRLDPQIAYLGAAAPARSTPLARAYRMRHRLAFNLKRLKAWLRDAGCVAGPIKKRRFPLEADELRRLLGTVGKGPGQPVTLICTRVEDRPEVFICDPVS